MPTLSANTACNAQKAQRPNYVGISGAVFNPVDGTTNLYGTAGTYGWHVTNGVLAANYGARMRDLTDGTTNVIMMGEQGRPRTDNSDNRSCNWCGGAWEGCYYNATSSISGQFCQNLVNIAYGNNNMATGLAQADQPYKSSNPLSSRHDGGVHVLRGDGTVAFISDNINFRILLGLAHKSDGNPLGEY